MSPFLNIIPSHSNVLLHMSQSRALQMIAQTLLILLFPSLNSNIMLHAIFVVGISHGIHIAYDWAKVISSFYKRATAVPLVVGFSKCAALFVCLYQQVQHVCCSILFYLGFVMWSLFLDSRGSKALMRTYCVGLALLMLLPVSSAVCSFCHGAAEQFGCKGTITDCPFNTGVEASNGMFCIGNIRQKLGGIDAVRAAATSKAKEVHGKTFFRALGGNPGSSNDVPAEATIKGNSGSKKGCASWNLGNKHSAGHLDASGRCKFAHKCDAVLTENDANGTPKHCLNSAGTAGHKRGQCDHPKKK
jgi:hypothetical protein